MKKEMNSLGLNKTWKLVQPLNKKALDVKWVYSRKAGGLFKARLVVKGFQ